MVDKGFEEALLGVYGLAGVGKRWVAGKSEGRLGGGMR